MVARIVAGPALRVLSNAVVPPSTSLPAVPSSGTSQQQEGDESGWVVGGGGGGHETDDDAALRCDAYKFSKVLFSLPFCG
jgi:hypothetical protein